MATGADPAFHSWAPRPVMGWNSWDFYGTSINEAKTKAHADYMAANLLSHGWNLITVDIQWYQPNATGFGYDAGAIPIHVVDEWGRMNPATNRFPSAADGAGFKPLADYVHSKGLKFGIHMMRGIPRKAWNEDLPVKGTSYTARDIADTSSTCSWNPDMYGVDMSKPGAQAYYDSVMELVASWEVDFVKIDDLSRPYHLEEIEAIRAAIDKTGRPIVFSTSPGETPVGQGAHVMDHANQWRISDDFWDNWGALYSQFQRLHDWTPYRGPGHFPDADMLPLGKLEGGSNTATGRSTNFSQNEQYTLMSLWSIARSPLIHGGDMTQMDPFTLSLLTNDEVIAVNQYSSHNRQLFRNGNQVAWVADDENSSDKYLAVFNTGGSTTNVPINLSTLGFTGSAQIRSLWDQSDLGSFTGSFSPSIASHGASLYRLSGALLPTPWITDASGADGEATVSWESVSSADSYRVKRATAETGPYELVAENLTGTTFTNTGLVNGTTYFYVVSAMVSGQETPDSGARSAVPAGLPGIVGWNYDRYGTVNGSRVAGVEPAANWNNTWPNNPVTNLIDNNGVPTTLDIAYSSYNTWTVNNPQANPGQDADGTYNRELLNGYLNAGNAGWNPPITASSVTLTEIPHGQYHIIVYFSSDAAGREGDVTDGTTTYSFKTIGPASVTGTNAVLTQTTDTAGTYATAANYAVFTGLSGSSQTITVQMRDNGEWGGIAGFQVVPDPVTAPAFSLQPAGRSAVAGSNVTLTSSASANQAPTYQWEYSGTGVSGWTNLAGETNATLELTFVQLSAEGYYRVVATNDGGSTTSDAAFLDIFPAWDGLVSHDPFDTAAGYVVGELPTQNPTIGGYTGAWTGVDFGDAQPAISSGSLSYGDPQYLRSSGDKVSVANNTTGGETAAANSGRAYRLLAPQLVADDATSGTRYLSFLFQSGQETGGTVYQTLALYNSNTADANRFFDAGLTTAGGANYTFGGSNGVYTSTGVTADASVHLIVVKFDMSATAASDSVTVWVDPALGAGDPTGGVTVSGKDLRWDRLAFSDYDGNSAAWDEIRWGSTFDSVTLNSAPANDFANWIANYPGVETLTGFGDDADGDGIDNGLESIFGTDPGASNQGVVQVAKSGSTVTFQHPQNATPPSDVSAAYVWSTDLATLFGDGASSGGTTVSFSASPDTPVAGTTTVTATITGTVPAKLFVALKATQNTP